MTSIRIAARAPADPLDGLFAATAFASAALVFVVEPIAGRLMLPMLGGGPSVWNTSLAVFQTALLVGYAYAHLLQRLPGLKAQALVHGVVLIAAGAVLPLRVHPDLGAPSTVHPALWLVGALALTLGAPFAALSATAPLVQAWRARLGTSERGEVYSLYAASNLGSLAALLAYPILVEPMLPLHVQTLAWSLGYAGFVALIGVLALAAVGVSAEGPATLPQVKDTSAPAWRERLVWLGLAALPASLMLGVTSYITTDVASAPFLWVLPLALYLLSFVAAFQARPLIAPSAALGPQAAAAAACAAIMPFNGVPFLVQLGVHLAAFFLTALVCHQALVARRPPAERLTDFYLWMSLGGVIGGGFNAFLAPAIFDNVWEYPLALALSGLARPSRGGRIRSRTFVMLGLALIAAPASAITATFRLHGGVAGGPNDLMQVLTFALIAAAAIAAFAVRGEALLFSTALAIVAMGANGAAERATTIGTWRSFFGVLSESHTYAHGLGGEVHLLSDGTTLHGAEAVNPRFRCSPLVYYTPRTPIGQVFRALQAERPSLRVGAVGLGTGSIAAYVRPADRLTFFEIDPLVARIAADPRRFRYLSDCAKGPVDMVFGDARLTLAHQPMDAFDLLVIDAFASDAVPTHLLTVEAVRGYLAHLKPDGVLVLHLSNRNLELTGPAQAVALAASGHALLQEHRVEPGQGAGWESDEDAVIVARSAATLAPFARDRRWRPADPGQARPWTDDYVNLPGALWRKLVRRYGG